ncbi:hypothetical protein OROGR_022083 [Orobanche gracilis]
MVMKKCPSGEKLAQQECPELKNTVLLRSFLKHKVNSLVELHTEKGENFVEGLLVDSWLLHLVSASGSVENSIAKWAFNLMLYSSNVRLMEAAGRFF